MTPNNERIASWTAVYQSPPHLDPYTSTGTDKSPVAATILLNKDDAGGGGWSALGSALAAPSVTPGANVINRPAGGPVIAQTTATGREETKVTQRINLLLTVRSSVIFDRVLSRMRTDATRW